MILRKTFSAPAIDRNCGLSVLFEIFNPFTGDSVVGHIALVEKNNARLVLSQLVKLRIAAAERYPCVKKLGNAVNKRQALLNEPPCFCHMAGKPLNRLLL